MKALARGRGRMRGWLAGALLLFSIFAAAASAASEPLLFDIPTRSPGPIFAGRAYDLVIVNASGEGARGPGAVYDLVAQGSSSPLASAGALADPERPGRVRLEFAGVTFPERGSFEVVGPEGFRLSFDVVSPPGGASDAPRLVVDGGSGRILEPGRPPAGTRVDFAIVKLPPGDGSILPGSVFALRAPGEDAPRERRAAVDEGGDAGLGVTFGGVTLTPGAWRVEGPSGFVFVLRVNANGAGEDPTDAVTIRHHVGSDPPPAPVGTRADLSIVMIGITGARDVLSEFELVAPSGRVASTATAYVIDPREGERLAVTFAGATLDEVGSWTVRGPEEFSFSIPIKGRALPGPAAGALLACSAAAALALARASRPRSE